MNTSGVILDIWDDPDGLVLKSFFPTANAVPEFLKTASFVEPEELHRLPDDVFALVHAEDGVVLRKYACLDEGTTFTNALYFIACKDKLPEELRKQAAEGLLHHFEVMNMEVPDQLKQAMMGLGAVMKGVGTAATTVGQKALKNPLGTLAAGMGAMEVGSGALKNESSLAGKGMVGHG